MILIDILAQIKKKSYIFISRGENNAQHVMIYKIYFSRNNFLMDRELSPINILKSVKPYFLD